MFLATLQYIPDADLDDPEPIVDAVRGSDVVASSVTGRSTADPVWVVPGVVPNLAVIRRR
jgi:hypothetical protein